MRSRRGILAVLFVLALGAAVLPLVWRSRPEQAQGLLPEPVFPFGMARRGSLVFRWAIPTDGAPVRVELFDAMRIPLWRSELAEEGTLQPPKTALERWPDGDLVWRPVAVPAGGSAERPGDLAAFSLSP